MPEIPSSAPANAGPDHMEAIRPTYGLFVISVLGLFLELMLIRWIGTEVRIFAYYQNAILVVCFLGLGMGCWTCRRPFVLREMLLPLLLLLLLLAVPYTRHGLYVITDWLATLSGAPIWVYEQVSDAQKLLNGGLGLAMTFLLMVLVWAIFVPIGRLLGRLMDDHPNTIQAYSINVAGSLIGIWLFVLLCVFYLPPTVWMILVASMLFVVAQLAGPIAIADRLFLVAAIILTWASDHQEVIEKVLSPLNMVLIGRPTVGSRPETVSTYWSPYQKLVLERTTFEEEVGDYRVLVNNVGYQALQNLSDDFVRNRKDVFPKDERERGQYDLPLVFHPRVERMLIVGAGTGNDAAAGVRHRVPEIVAVDIDPAIIEIGKEYHPEQPYAQGTGVQVINDDARSYFANCPPGRFDLIVFGLLDAHTGTSMTNAGLDHYVYTKESLERAKELLRPGGILVLSFWAKKPFIADRIGSALRQVFSQEPLHFFIRQDQYGWGGAMFVCGDLATVRQQIDRHQLVKSKIAEWQKEKPIELTGTTVLATDDWPYLYLESRHIPLLYYFLGMLLLLLFAFAIRRMEARSLIAGWQQSHWHFFFLGAAFMLLEVQNISKASVVLGNTWLVNAVIISGILMLILLANLIVALYPHLPLGPVYVLLCGSCLGLYFVDLAWFAFMPYATKALLVGLLTSLPMLFSGIVFIRSFASIAGKDVALGANLFGALVGGLLQSVTFVTGIKALLLIVAAFYLAAFLTRPRVTLPAAESPVLEPAQAS
jgi:spermidine synthase